MATEGKKGKNASISEAEKERLEGLIPFDTSKEFYNNISVLLKDDPIFQKWTIEKRATTMKGTSLTLKFVLKDMVIAKMIEDMDGSQKKIADFVDPDQE